MILSELGLYLASMSQSMNGSIMPDSFHKDYESDGETSHNVAGLLVKTNNRHCATAEDAESRETSPDLAEKHRADQTRPNPLSAPKPARRTVNMGGMVPSDPKHSSIEELR